jgi:uncharacterized protein (TIGR03118 family)
MAGAALRSYADDAERYLQVNLVSDQAGVALLQDTNLVNAWGTSFSSGSPFWISDNGSGLATLYSATNDSSGFHVTKLGLQVGIPGDGTPTGQLFNGTGAFHGDNFIFASEDGTISGWRQALGTNAEVLVPGSANSVYKGITLVTESGASLLLAANFRQAKLDVYDTNLTLVGQFSDPAAPVGYAPFNVTSLGGMVFVTYAKQDVFKHDDVAGKGHGLIDIFDPSTHMFHRFATGSDAGGKLNQLNSPWGLAIAPGTFGAHANQLLVGNFGSGFIATFTADRKFRGFVDGIDGEAIIIDGLWALAFGNNARAGSADTLFFTAGPNGETHGLFGSISPVAGEGEGDGGDD